MSNIELNKIYNEDCLAALRRMEDDSVDCCVTSPPYYALRDYGCDGQIGLEDTPQLYIDRLTEVFMEVYRVLKPTGTLWLNIGDSYNGNKKGNTEQNKHKGVVTDKFKKNCGEEQNTKTLSVFRGCLPFLYATMVGICDKILFGTSPTRCPKV